MSSGIRFPVNLPVPGRAGYGDTEEATRSAFQPEIGMGRRRQRYRSTPRLFDVEWTFTQDQYTAFDRWWENTIDGGALPFDIQLLDDNETLTWFTVYWLEEYEAEVVGVMDWRVRGRLRAVDASFGTTRPSGTDELHGAASIGVVAAARMKVGKSIRGIAQIGAAPTGQLNSPPLHGSSTPGINTVLTRAKFTPWPWRGEAAIGVEAPGRLEIGVFNSYPELSRQWQNLDWLATVAAQDINSLQETQAREWMEN